MPFSASSTRTRGSAAKSAGCDMRESVARAHRRCCECRPGYSCSARLAARGDRDLPDGVHGRGLDRVDHAVEIGADQCWRAATDAGERVGVSVAPGTDDPGKRVAWDAQCVDDDIVHRDIPVSGLLQQWRRVAADAAVAPDAGEKTNCLVDPETIRIEIPGGREPQHPV